MAGLRLLRRKSPTTDFASIPVLCSRDGSKSEAEWVDGAEGAGEGPFPRAWKILGRSVALSP